MTGTTSMPWVKLRTDLLEDLRFGRLSSSPKARFFELLMLAGKLDAGGYFFEAGHELTDDEIAWKLRCLLSDLQSDMNILEGVALLHRNGRGWCINGFEDEQGPTQADKRAAWKDRQKKHREEGHATVTGDKIVTGVNVTHTEEIKRRLRGEEEESASLAQTGDAGPASAIQASPVASLSLDLQTNPEEDHQTALISSRDKSEREKAFLSGYTKFPESPAQAAADPIIGLFRDVTGRLPGISQYKTVIETILFIRGNIAKSGRLQSVVDYLQPYWLAWSGRKSQTGKPYSPSNLTWLTEWAVNGSIPPIGGDTPSSNIPRPPSVEETRKRLEEQSKQVFTPPPQDVLAKIGKLTKSMSGKR